MLRPAKGNMYSFVTHTWNVIKGKCPHDCSYCYMKQFKQPELHFDEKELKTDLGEGNFIFVGSSCDMWADLVPADWINKTVSHCEKYSQNTYLFQSKNPERFYRLATHFNYPTNTILGTTIETNRIYPQMGETPSSHERSEYMSFISEYFKTMVTIEPIMDFDLNVLVDLVQYCNPLWVNIGADSKGHNLSEPSSEKITALIEELSKFTKVIPKKNLNRIWNQRPE